MINATSVTGEPVTPAPSTTQKVTPTSDMSEPAAASSSPKQKKAKRKIKPKFILGIIFLGLLLIGGIAALVLIRMRQDIRQQAATEAYPDKCYSEANNCELVTTSDKCSAYSYWHTNQLACLASVCEKDGGTWNEIDLQCDMPVTGVTCYSSATEDCNTVTVNDPKGCAASSSYHSNLLACKKAYCENSGGTWDEIDLQCDMPVSGVTCYSSASEACNKVTVNDPKGCAASSSYHSNLLACKKAYCENSGNEWDEATLECLPVIGEGGVTCYSSKTGDCNAVTVNDPRGCDAASIYHSSVDACKQAYYGKCSGSYPTATTCFNQLVETACYTGQPCTKTTVVDETNNIWLCSCPEAGGQGGVGGACQTVTQSCDDNNPCCDDLVCVGVTGNRTCQSPDEDPCPGASCSRYISFQCDQLHTTSQSAGHLVCEQNVEIAPNRQAAIDRARETGCGQWDQVCDGGPNENQLCGEYEIIDEDCGGDGGVTPSPSPSATPPVGPQCLSISMDIDEPTLGDNVTLTCGQVAGATQYRFRLIRKVTGLDPVFIPLSATGRVSQPYLVFQSGTYAAQCQICYLDQNGQEYCPDFEAVPSELSQ